APNFTINVAVGDSLLHGAAPAQQAFAVDADDPATRHLYETEDAETIHLMLQARYHAVVANPPYITPKDPAARAAYRRRYARTCYREYHLSAPFTQRLFDVAVRGSAGRPAGFVGQIIDDAFKTREYGKPVIEQFLAKDVNLTHVIDTGGVNIPG